MSLLLDRRYILEHLRLAVLSVEDPVCANVVSLRVPRPTANPQTHAHTHYSVSKSSSFNTGPDATTASAASTVAAANSTNPTPANHTSSSTLALDAATLPLAKALPSTVVRQLSAIDFDHDDLATLLHDEHWAVVHDNSPPTALLQAIPNHFQSFLHPHDFDDDEDNSMFSAPSLGAASAPPLPTVPAGVILSDPSLTTSSSSSSRRPSNASKASSSAATAPVVSSSTTANQTKAPVRRSSLAAATSAAYRRRSSSTSAVPSHPSGATHLGGGKLPTPSIKLASIHGGGVGGGSSTSIDLNSSTTTSSTASLSKKGNDTTADPPRNAAPVVLATSMGEELELEADYAFAEDDLNASLMMDSSSLMQVSSREESRRGSTSSQKSTRRSSASSAAGAAGANPIITLPTISSCSESPKPDNDLVSRHDAVAADLPPPPISPFTAATASVTAAAAAATTPASPAPIPQPATLTSPATAAAVAHQRLQLLPDRTSSTSTHGTSASDTPLSPREPAPSPAPSSALSDHTTSGPAPLFVRKPVPPRHLLSTAGAGGTWSSTSATPSALSMLLGAPKSATGAAGAAARNPFAATYARYAGKHAKAVTALRIHVPYARAPGKLIMPVEVARGATVEQVIGYVLYEYVELGYKPRIDKPRQDVAQWAMRIVEDDGSIDEDFPALDRGRPIERFQFDAFALCEVGKWPVPVDEEEEEERVGGGGDAKSELVTRPGSAATAGADGQHQHQQQQQVHAAVAAAAAAAAAAQASGASADMSFGSTAAATGAASSSATPTPTRSPSSAGNLPPKQFIKVHLYSTIEVRHTTTLNVTSSTPLADIFHAVCRKRGVNPKDYELRLSDLRTPILDLDKPFSSLASTTAGAGAGGASVGEMFLMKKSIGASAGDMWLRPPGEEEALASAAAAAAATSAWGRVGLSAVSQFKKFNVVRKMPMFMGKQERVLAVDGEYLHVLPAEGWRGGTQLFDSMKTSSYHVSAVIACKQNKKLPSHFRLQVLRDHHPGSSATSAGGPVVGGASGIGGGVAAVGGPVIGAGGGGSQLGGSGTAGLGGGGTGASGAGTSGLSGSLAAREGKTYDFEAQSKEQAAEICQTIINLVQTVRRRAGVGKDKGR